MASDGATGDPGEDASSTARVTRDERPQSEERYVRGGDFGEGSIVDHKYRLVRLLGEGGMGAVYEAQNLDTLKRCAVKLILTKHAGDEHHRARFFREARASSVADSEHIVQIFDCDTDRAHDTPYMVMELLSGESLDAAIVRIGVLDPDIAARIALQAAAGLARAHAAGIVHRDIKPANLFLAHSDLGDVVVKLLDFGIAKMRLEQGAALTQTGSTIGTPAYIAPEQALGHKTVDAAADVWALGVVLFEMLSGTIPFEADTGMALMLKATTEPVPHIQSRAPWVSPELATIVHRCLARDRAHRYADGAHVRDALEQVVADSRLTVDGIAAASEDVRSRVAPRLALAEELVRAAPTKDGDPASIARGSVASDVRRKKLVLVAAGAAALALAIGIPMMVGSDGDRDPAEQPTIATTLPDASAAPVERPTELAIPLQVGPAGVTVEIDGVPATVERGAVIVTGRPGDGRIIVLRERRGRELRQEVVIRSNGTVTPDRLELTDSGIARSKASARSIEQAKREERAAAIASPTPATAQQPATGTAQPAPPATAHVIPADAGTAQPTPTAPAVPVDARSPAPAPPSSTPPADREQQPTPPKRDDKSKGKVLDLPTLPLPVSL